MPPTNASVGSSYRQENLGLFPPFCQQAKKHLLEGLLSNPIHPSLPLQGAGVRVTQQAGKGKVSGENNSVGIAEEEPDRQAVYELPQPFPLIGTGTA